MVDLSLTVFFLSGLTTYGPLIVGLSMFLGPLGVPVPSPLVVWVAGALARQGLMDLSTALFMGLSGSILGNSAVYGIGRFATGWAERRFGGSSAWRNAAERFRRNGGLAIYLSHFLLTPLGLPTNLIAGGSSYPYRRFVAFVVAGTLSWLALYGGLGYVFGSQGEAVLQAIRGNLAWITGLVTASVGVYFLLRRPRRRKDPAQAGYRPASS